MSREEFEEVVGDPDDTEDGRSSDRLIARGMTSTGGDLCCVYEFLDDGTIVYPITAFDIGD